MTLQDSNLRNSFCASENEAYLAGQNLTSRNFNGFRFDPFKRKYYIGLKALSPPIFSQGYCQLRMKSSGSSS